MKKRLLLIALVILLSTGTVAQTEIRAEAAGTVTAVGVVKAVLVLLAIAGVGITAGTIFDNGNVDNETIANFRTWLNNRDPEFYTEFMVMATAIMAGRVVNTMSPLFYRQLRTYTSEYFGTSTATETVVGSTSFNINQLAFVPNGTQFVTTPYGKSYTPILGYQVIACYFTNNNSGACFFLPVKKSDQTSHQGTNYLPSSYPFGNYGIYADGTYMQISWHMISGDNNITFFNTKMTGNNEGQIRTVMQEVATKYYTGQYNNISEDVSMRPFETVGNVAATSADAMVVGAGQTLTKDENDEVVIADDITFDLTGINIDNWLQSLADSSQTYAEAMQAIALAAVNTQTQTLEEVQAISQALTVSQAGTGTITGSYTVSLSDLFPFCIPFDLYNIISCFKADPVTPSAEITIPVGYDGSEFTWETYTVSLSAFDPVAAVVRVLEYIAFIIGLMLVTRKLIEG